MVLFPEERIISMNKREERTKRILMWRKRMTWRRLRMILRRRI